MTMHSVFTPKNVQNPHILHLQQERDQLIGELEELREDLHLVQGIIRHKQKKLRGLNQDIAQKVRKTGDWQMIQACAGGYHCQTTGKAARQPVLTCLPGGKP